MLSLDRELKPDPNLARIAISLPKPTVNADWPEPGGYPNHAMQHLALPYRLAPAWKVSIGEGSGRYTQVLAQPVVEGGRVYAMDGGSEVGAYAASNGARIWQVDVKPRPITATPSAAGSLSGKGVCSYPPATPRYWRSIPPPAR